MKFASTKVALGICDRCGLSYKLKTLTNQIIDRKRSGIMVCKSCNDIDQEQYGLSRVRADDAFALRDARPDTNPGREPNDPYNPPVQNSP